MKNRETGKTRLPPRYRMISRTSLAVIPQMARP